MLSDSIDDVRTTLRRAIAADRDAMRDLLAALVSVPSENPPGREYDACVDVIEAAVRDLRLDRERVPIAAADGPRAALFAWLGGAGPTLYLHGHYDVVPAITADQFAAAPRG